MTFDQEISEQISRFLLTGGHTVSVAEDVTSGLLQFSFSLMQNAPLFYNGGITAYTAEEKVRLLNLPQTEVRNCSCVSERIAGAMVLRAAELFGTDWAIGVTGHGSPVRGAGFRMFMVFSVVFNGTVLTIQRMELDPATQQAEVQFNYTQYILEQFRDLLENQLQSSA